MQITCPTENFGRQEAAFVQYYFYYGVSGRTKTSRFLPACRKFWVYKLSARGCNLPRLPRGRLTGHFTQSAAAAALNSLPPHSSKRFLPCLPYPCAESLAVWHAIRHPPPLSLSLSLSLCFDGARSQRNLCVYCIYTRRPYAQCDSHTIPNKLSLYPPLTPTQVLIFAPPARLKILGDPHVGVS